MSETSLPQTERQGLNVPYLVRELEKLAPRIGSDGKEKGDRAALAALRRGLGKKPGEAAEMFPILLPILPQGELSRRDERIVFLVASLFALYPDAPHWPETARQRWQRNLGASLRRLAEQTDSEGPERRTVALLNSDVADLSHHLRGIITLLKSAKSPVPVDWARLIWDLQDWLNAERRVQKDWASGFWGGRRLRETPDGPTSEEPE